jgi:hypothetical protein
MKGRNRRRSSIKGERAGLVILAGQAESLDEDGG